MHRVLNRCLWLLLLLAALQGCTSPVDHVADDGLVERIGLEEALDRLRGVLERAENVNDLAAITPTHYAYRGNSESGFLWRRLLGEEVYYVSVVGVTVFSDARVEVLGNTFGDDYSLLDVLSCASGEDAHTLADLLLGLRRLAVERADDG